MTNALAIGNRADSLDQWDSRDRWAWTFFDAMLSQQLSVDAFESAVAERWNGRDFIIRAPATAELLRRQATTAIWNDAGYAHAAPELGFRSHYMIGVPGLPGAVYIEAPAEATASPALQSLNRPLHQHDSGRIVVITSGAAIFHVLVGSGDEAVMVDCAVEAGDIVFWPAWTPHTFDALDGFGLITAMASYVSPAADGFVFPVADDVLTRPRRNYADYRSE